MTGSEPAKNRKAEAEAFIKEATERLKGPMSNIERALLVADRKDAREYLAELAKEQK